MRMSEISESTIRIGAAEWRVGCSDAVLVLWRVHGGVGSSARTCVLWCSRSIGRKTLESLVGRKKPPGMTDKGMRVHDHNSLMEAVPKRNAAILITDAQCTRRRCMRRREVVSGASAEQRRYVHLSYVHLPVRTHCRCVLRGVHHQCWVVSVIGCRDPLLAPWMVREGGGASTRTRVRPSRLIN